MVRASVDEYDVVVGGGSVHVHPALSEVVAAAFEEVADSPYSTAPDWRNVGSN